MGLQGGIDMFDRRCVLGWVQMTGGAAEPVVILVTIDGRYTARIVADVYRQDLEQAGIGDGRYGFICELHSLSPFTAHNLTMVTERDGDPIPGTPLLIPPETQWDDEIQVMLTAALVDTDSPELLRHRAAFLAQQAERLLQLSSDRLATLPRDLSSRHFGARWSGCEVQRSEDLSPSILVVLDTLPVEGRDLDGRVVLSYLRSLQRLGYSCQVVPADLAGGAAEVALAAEDIVCCCLPWSGSVEEVLRRDTGRFAVVLLHGGSSHRYFPLARHYQPQARLIYSAGDSELLQLGRSVWAADRVITHSRSNAEILRRHGGNTRAHYVPWSVTPQPSDVAFDSRSGLACIADFAQPAELEAAWWLIREVMPRLRARDPSINCLLAGPSMPDALRAAVGPGIRVRPGIKEASLLDEVRLTATPAAGSNGAIWLSASLAAGVPCVCSTAAGAALGLPSPLDGLCVDDPAAFADLCYRLHNEAGFNRSCRDAGLAFVAHEMSEVQLDVALAAALPTTA